MTESFEPQPAKPEWMCNQMLQYLKAEDAMSRNILATAKKSGYNPSVATNNLVLKHYSMCSQQCTFALYIQEIRVEVYLQIMSKLLSQFILNITLVLAIIQHVSRSLHRKCICSLW